MKITKGLYTATHSDLYINILHIYHQSENSLSFKGSIHYKLNNEIVPWFGYNQPRNFRFDMKLVKERWSRYENSSNI